MRKTSIPEVFLRVMSNNILGLDEQNGRMRDASMQEFNCEEGEHRITWTGSEKGVPPPDGTYQCTGCGEKITWVNDSTAVGSPEILELCDLGAESNACPKCAQNGIEVATEDCKLGHIRWPDR